MLRGSVPSTLIPNLRTLHNNSDDEGQQQSGTRVKPVTISSIYDRLGFSVFHIRFTAWVNLLWFLSGVTSTAVPFLLDAAQERFNLTVYDRSFILVGSKTNGLLTGFLCGLSADLYGRSIVMKVVLCWVALCMCILVGCNSVVFLGSGLVFMASGRDGYVNVSNSLIV